MEAPAKNTIEVTQTIHASASKIFNALTLGTEIEKWFASNAFTNPVVEGQYSIRFLFNDTKYNHERKGTFLELARPSKVAYTWMDRTIVTFTITPVGEQTVLKLVHSGWGDNDQREIQDHTIGWNFFLRNLKNVLEQDVDNRVQEKGMIIKNALKKEQGTPNKIAF